jgi:glutathionylspermidine synthase
MIPELIGTLLEAYKHLHRLHRDLPADPRLALVEAVDSPSVPEFRIICNAAKEAGIEATFATLDELEYDGTNLLVKGEVTPLIYRRAMLEEIQGSPLIEAVRNQRACVVNPFRSRVANNKKLIALLKDPRFAHLIESGEEQVLDEAIPWTRSLEPGNTTYGKWTLDLLPFVVENRERLAVKPASDYAGRGVKLGFETTQAEWERVVNEHAGKGDYVVQEYIPVPDEMFPTVKDGHIHMELKHFNINPFAIGGHFAGSITRISDHAVINVSAGGGLLPSVVGSRRRSNTAEPNGFA